MAQITLFADAESLQTPSLIGLEGEYLIDQGWLNLVHDAAQARLFAQRARGACEFWVAGSDQVDAINLAAAIKHDRADHRVALVAFEPTGSTITRAQAAGIDCVLDRASFVSRYRSAKAAICSSSETARLPIGASANVEEEDRADEAQRCHGRFVSAVDSVAEAVRTKTGCVVVVAGAGGGVGKSTVAVLAAYAAARKGLSCVLVDADVEFGDMHYLVGKEDALRLDEAVACPERASALPSAPGEPAILAAPRNLEQSEVVSSQMPKIIEDLRRSYDCVIVGMGNGMSEWQLSLIERASHVVYLIDQRPSSIWVCRHVLDLLARCGIATQGFKFALNRCSRQSLFSSIDASCALSGIPISELADGGREVGELLGAGQPQDLFESRNALVASLAPVLESVLPSASAAAQPQTVRMPRQRRFFAGRRKKAACL